MYIKKEKTLGYIDYRLKHASLPKEARDELRHIASELIHSTPEPVVEFQSSRVFWSYNGIPYCEKCRTIVNTSDNYCRKCGSKLRWL